ncbi:type I-E CRISPR-associated protein Cas5/CasD [Gilvimarinus agarilyticus]|uniref:type I-E CRISPR-associated protein Cas5/CasD n=1 Tax=Gilvimarinus sp. 2_MG-2023 TaxID=3062666 RepID=UPI001C0A0B6D|nr:type I-E CRISPR-associated protein Cas5/CasD [Gilvimarinus sp. 2_MG-2023]MBU2885469.1 type I-E CRISPR-associated protein Cas5/CasD [Gilvimarinus agarilyticus]MDO6570369.1 type I-E CRISPR-associated protein Cas5/CasD [Gilvimarinus sp. 2_MG-2023]
MQCLVFRLYGAMASWGGTAVGGVRSTRPAPSRSAVIGLLSAALGLRREQEDEVARLNNSIGMMIKSESDGRLLRDYHTTQVPSADKKAIWPHRKAELENTLRDVNTILSTRDYRVDGHWLVALTLRVDAGYTLESIRDALNEPVFPLYLGRKSCPLSAPIYPLLLNEGGLHHALERYQFPISPVARSESVLYSQTVQYEWDDGLETNLKPSETHERWDNPASRLRWQFEKRLVHSAREQRSE